MQATSLALTNVTTVQHKVKMGGGIYIYIFSFTLQIIKFKNLSISDIFNEMKPFILGVCWSMLYNSVLVSTTQP